MKTLELRPGKCGLKKYLNKNTSFRLEIAFQKWRHDNTNYDTFGNEMRKKTGKTGCMEFYTVVETFMSNELIGLNATQLQCVVDYLSARHAKALEA